MMVQQREERKAAVVSPQPARDDSHGSYPESRGGVQRAVRFLARLVAEWYNARVTRPSIRPTTVVTSTLAGAGLTLPRSPILAAQHAVKRRVTQLQAA